MLTVTYVTTRKDNRVEWFLESLFVQWQQNKIPLTVIVVDYHQRAEGRTAEVLSKARGLLSNGIRVIHTPPKPTVWQGPFRITTQDYFAASNARNTALCLAPDGWIAYVDDLSVLLPGWLDRVCAAMRGNYVVMGTYTKVKDLVVEHGLVKSFTHDPQGDDHRPLVARKQFAHTPTPPEVYPATGGWFYGCSVAGPIEAFLTINGWDEDCDGMGYEDTACGFMIEKAGYTMRFDPNMGTYESWELHFVEKPLLRIDKADVKGHKDASHAYVHMLNNGRHTAPNYFGEGGIRAQRIRTLKGEPFPIMGVPDRDWRDGALLSKM